MSVLIPYPLLMLFWVNGLKTILKIISVFNCAKIIYKSSCSEAFKYSLWFKTHWIVSKCTQKNKLIQKLGKITSHWNAKDLFKHKITTCKKQYDIRKKTAFFEILLCKETMVKTFWYPLNWCLWKSCFCFFIIKDKRN